METEMIVYILVGFLAVITLIRREMLKPEVKVADRREANRRKGKRRAHMGRRQHDFNDACMDEDRRQDEDRRTGSKDRRHRERRH